jgi:hypothetical protein
MLSIRKSFPNEEKCGDTVESVEVINLIILIIFFKNVGVKKMDLMI